MGVKSTAYSVTGTGLTGLGYIPLTIGTGLVTAGSYMVDAGNWLLNKGAECKLYADGLKAMNAGKIDKTEVEQIAKANNWSFKTALVEVYINMMQAQQQAQPTPQTTVQPQPTPQPQQVTLVQEDCDVAAAMATAEALV